MCFSAGSIAHSTKVLCSAFFQESGRSPEAAPPVGSKGKTLYSQDQKGATSICRALIKVLGVPRTFFQEGSWPPEASYSSHLAALAGTGAGEMGAIPVEGVDCQITRMDLAGGVVGVVDQGQLAIGGLGDAVMTATADLSGVAH